MDEQTADFFNPPADAPAPPPADAPIIMPPPPGEADFFGGEPIEDAVAPAPAVLVLDDPGQPAPDMDFTSPPQDEYTSAEGYASIPEPEGGYAPPDMSGYPSEMDAFAAPPAPTDAFAAPPSDFPPTGDYAPPMEGDPMALPAPEPEEKEQSPMAKWNEEWQVTLRERKDAENAKKAAQVESARAELETFQTERYTRRENRMAKNRTEEQNKLEAMEADLENDNSWQRVVKLVDLQQDSIDGGMDRGRMRDVIIMLKNDTQRATVLA